MAYALGLIHDHNPPPVADLATFATRTLPPPSVSVTPPDVGGWPMACNDTEGDCTIAGGPVHGSQVFRKLINRPYVYPGDAAVNTCYRGLTGGGDTGLLLTSVLNPWRTTGLLGDRIGQFAPVQALNTTALKQAIDWFGLAYVAVNLPNLAQQQFNADGSGVWQLTGTTADSSIDGGHCIILVGYDAQGNLVGVTWGALVTITPAWWAQYAVLAYAIIPTEFEARGGDARGLNISLLDNTLDTLAAAA